MTHEEHTAAQYVRAVTWAPDMKSRVLIDGVPYIVGELIRDTMDVSGHEYDDEVVAVLARVARDGDAQAKNLIKRMADTFANLRCPPEPEPEESEHLKYLDHGEYDAQTVRVPGFLMEVTG